MGALPTVGAVREPPLQRARYSLVILASDPTDEGEFDGIRLFCLCFYF